MEQETKQEFQQISQRFDDLTQMVEDLTSTMVEGFESIEERMATKDDIARLDQRIDHLTAEIMSLRNDLEGIKAQLDRLEKQATEDTDAFAKDILYLREKVKALEQRLTQVEMARS